MQLDGVDLWRYGETQITASRAIVRYRAVSGSCSIVRYLHTPTGPGSGDYNITPLYTGPGPGDYNITPLYTGPD